MKSKIIITVVVVVLALGFVVSSASAQGFSSILEKLDKLEARMGQLEKLQKSDMQQLQNQLTEIQPGGANANISESVEVLEQTMTALESQLGQLTDEWEHYKTEGGSAEEEAVFAELTMQLRGLITELRNTIEQSGESEYSHQSNVTVSEAVVASRQGGVYLAGEETPPLLASADQPMHSVGETVTIVSPLEKLTPQISGFVDASYFYDGSSGENTFGHDQIEVDVEQAIGEIGTIRADVEWVNDGEGGFALDAEQGYVTFHPSYLGPVNLTFGKFNAPIGFELLDAPDMYQYSHALVFNYGLPTNLTGAMFSAGFDPGIDMCFYVCNGWDQNVDHNTGKTAGGRFGYTYGDLGCVGLSAIYGADGQSEGDHLSVVDLDVTMTPHERLTLGGEFNYGSDENGDDTYHWTGFLMMAHWDFTDWFGTTVRYDFFDDQDGTRLGSNMIETRQAFAIAPTFSLGHGMGALLEFRIDASDEEVFSNKDGDPAKSATGFAFEMTYGF